MATTIPNTTLLGIVTPDLGPLQQDMIQIFMKEAIDTGASAGSFVNGGYDCFATDTLSGVSGTSGQTYDATNKLYGNGGTGYTANYASNATVTASASFGAGSLAGLVNGTFEDNTLTTTSGWILFDYGISVTHIPTKLMLYSWSNGTSGRCNAFTLDGSNNGTAFTQITTGTCQNASQWNTFTFLNTTAYRYLRVSITSTYAGASCGFQEIQMYDNASVTNMTLVTNTLSPAPTTAPTQVQVDLLWKDLSGSATLGTDLTIEATSNGGANWFSGTPINTGNSVNGFSLLKAIVPVTVSGTSVQTRIKALNNMSQQVKGVGIMCK